VQAYRIGALAERSLKGLWEDPQYLRLRERLQLGAGDQAGAPR